MIIYANVLWLQKDGYSKEEYEDSYCPKRISKKKFRYLEGDYFHFAIADGATETSFSKIWANILVHAYCSGKFESENLISNFIQIQKKWKNQLSKKSLPWYAEEKLKMGAYSSLLGVSIFKQDNDHPSYGTARIVAMGDSCVFLVRDNDLVYSFPIKESKEFNNRPMLLPSINNSQQIIDLLVKEKIELKKNDQFFLMTDAMACWFLKTYEDGHKP